MGRSLPFLRTVNAIFDFFHHIQMVLYIFIGTILGKILNHLLCFLFDSYHGHSLFIKIIAQSHMNNPLQNRFT